MRILLLCLLLFLPLGAQAQELSVFAASSLTEALGAAARSYESTHSGTRVRLHVAGSQVLAAQIEQGAPADLFISANPEALARLTQQDLLETTQVIASNRLVLAVSAELAGEVKLPADFARPGYLLAIGNPQVPVGRYTRSLFERLAAQPDFGAARVAALRANIVSKENQVKAIVAKLLLGEVDGGIVYASDLYAPSAKQLSGLPFPCEEMPMISYPAAVVREGQTTAARDFLAYLRSAEGLGILQQHGFLPPEEK